MQGASAAVELAGDTASKGLEAASGAASAALEAASEGIDRISGFFGRTRDKAKVLRQQKPNDNSAGPSSPQTSEDN